MADPQKEPHSDVSLDSTTSDQYDIARFINWIYSLEVLESPEAFDETNFLASLSDGLLYLKIIEKIESGSEVVDWSQVNFDVKNNKFKQLANCNYLLTLLDNFVSLIGLAKGRDLVERKLKSHLSVLWLLMRRWFICTQGHDDEEQFQQMANMYLPAETEITNPTDENNPEEQDQLDKLDNSPIVSYPVCPCQEDLNPLMIILYYGEEGEVFMNYHDDEELDCPTVPHRFDYMCAEKGERDWGVKREGVFEREVGQREGCEGCEGRGDIGEVGKRGEVGKIVRSKVREREVEEERDFGDVFDDKSWIEKLQKAQEALLPIHISLEPFIILQKVENWSFIISKFSIAISPEVLDSILEIHSYNLLEAIAPSFYLTFMTIEVENYYYEREKDTFMVFPYFIIQTIEETVFIPSESPIFIDIPPEMTSTAEFPATQEDPNPYPLLEIKQAEPLQISNPQNQNQNPSTISASPIPTSSSKKRDAINFQRYKEPSSNYLSNSNKEPEYYSKEDLKNYSSGFANLQPQNSEILETLGTELDGPLLQANFNLANYASAKSNTGLTNSKFCFMSNDKSKLTDCGDLYSKRKEHLGNRKNSSQRPINTPASRDRNLENMKDLNYRSHNSDLKSSSEKPKKFHAAEEKRYPSVKIAKFGVVTKEKLQIKFETKDQFEDSKYQNCSPIALRPGKPPVARSSNISNYKLTEKLSPCLNSKSQNKQPGTGTLTRKLNYESRGKGSKSPVPQTEAFKEETKENSNVVNQVRTNRPSNVSLFRNVAQFYKKEDFQEKSYLDKMSPDFKNLKPEPHKPGFKELASACNDDFIKDSFFFKLQKETISKYNTDGSAKKRPETKLVTIERSQKTNLLSKLSAHIDFAPHSSETPTLSPISGKPTPTLPFCMKLIQSTDSLHISKRYELLKINRFNNELLLKRIRTTTKDTPNPQIRTMTTMETMGKIETIPPIAPPSTYAVSPPSPSPSPCMPPICAPLLSLLSSPSSLPILQAIYRECMREGLMDRHTHNTHIHTQDMRMKVLERYRERLDTRG